MQVITIGLALAAFSAATGICRPAVLDEAALSRAFEEARTLQRQGRDQDAFLRYLAIPGAEYAAAALGRPRPSEYLRLLEGKGNTLRPGVVSLIKGDLLLALGKRSDALERYREAARLYAADAGAVRDLPPGNAYPVEPPGAEPSRSSWEGNPSARVRPFTLGPGSHRDNWLVRRFLALEAWEDARRELERLWSIHLRWTQPYVIASPVWRRPAPRPVASRGPAPTPPPAAPTTEPAWEKRLVRPAGFTGRGLQFALDYAYFLKRRGDRARALEVLAEPLRLMDLDRNPDLPWIGGWGVRPGEPMSEARAARCPELRRDYSPVPFWGGSVGVSRKEYLRLAFGEYKAQGRLQDLVRLLRDRAGRGDPRALRLLAAVRREQGRIGDSLALELEYIRASRFDPLTAAYRRGLADEAAQKLSQAAAEYERALALPYRPPVLPEKDEEQVEAQRMSAVLIIPPDPAFPEGRTRFRSEVLERLSRLYSALGRPDRALSAALRRFEVDEALLDRPEALKAKAQAFRAVGRGDAFTAWARKQVTRARSPRARASIAWVLRDYRTAAASLAPVAGRLGGALEEWKDQFRAAGREPLRLLLAALVKANPRDGQSRLDLLDLEGRPDSPEAIRALELLLEGGGPTGYMLGKHAYSRTRFPNPYTLAYRLMRLYERHGQEPKLTALGFRILEGRPPFARPAQGFAVMPANSGMVGGRAPQGPRGVPPLGTPRANASQRLLLEDLLDCLYVMLPHVRRPEDLARLQALAEGSGCVPLRNQVARLARSLEGAGATAGEEGLALAGGPASGAPEGPREPASAGWPGPAVTDPAGGHRLRYPEVTVRTLGLPEGVRLLTNRDDVRAISPDGRWVGTSWGLVRYRRSPDGALEVLQVPVGGRVTGFLQTPAGLFLATLLGPMRLDEPLGERPSPVLLDLELPGSLAPGMASPAVEQLLWWHEALWVRTRRGVFRYDPAAQEARFCGEVQGPLFVGAGRLWAGRSLLDEAAGEFVPLPALRREWGLVGATSGEVWADVWVNNEQRHRPALVDPKTLALQVLPISDVPLDRTLLVNAPFEVLAEDAERVWLRAGDGSAAVVHTRATGELRLQGADGNPPGEAAPPRHQGPAVWFPGSGWLTQYYCGSGTWQPAPGPNLEGDLGSRLTWREEDDGTLLVGSAVLREAPEDNYGFDDEFGMSRHVQDLAGGLFRLNPATGEWWKLGSPAGELSDAAVRRVVFDDGAGRAYVCTTGGVTVLSLPDATPVGRITVSDGLPSNKVSDAARVGGKLYLACELGDDRGGLAVMDLRSGLIQTLGVQDGLTSAKVKRLRVEGDRLHILYGPCYMARYGGGAATRLQSVRRGRWVRVGADDRVMAPRSSVLDTRTGAITDGVELPPFPPPGSKASPNAQGVVLPILGGAVWVDETHGDKRYLGGPHGLLVLEAGASPAPSPSPVEPVTLVLSQRQRWMAEAERAPVESPITPERLRERLGSPNPYFRARALAGALDPVSQGEAGYLPLVAPWVRDPCLELRSTALYLLTRMADPEAAEALRPALDDPDLYLRALAAQALAARGDLSGLPALREALELAEPGHDLPFGNLPFGATSSVGVQVDRESIYRALAPHANREVLELLLQRPLYPDGRESTTAIFRDLGASLRRHPEAVDLLLAAHDDGPVASGRIPLAQAVFQHAGPALLSRLHQALASRDRVVVSNAARACGALGSPASIPLLLRALDLESGLARASIVWALGELKAAQALPRLARLYVEARNDERRHAGTGFRALQAQAQQTAQYESLANLEAIGAEWDELKAAALRRPTDPVAHEDLLTPARILEAVARIGPAASQPFYRALAGEKDPEGRREAAVHLGDAPLEERARSAAVLRHLLGDPDELVRLRATVTLHSLGLRPDPRGLLGWLSTRWRGETLRQLQRVGDPPRLAFARQRLEAIASDPLILSDDRSLARTLLRRLTPGAGSPGPSRPTGRVEALRRGVAPRVPGSGTPSGGGALGGQERESSGEPGLERVAH